MTTLYYVDEDFLTEYDLVWRDQPKSTKMAALGVGLVQFGEELLTAIETGKRVAFLANEIELGDSISVSLTEVIDLLQKGRAAKLIAESYRAYVVARFGEKLEKVVEKVED